MNFAEFGESLHKQAKQFGHRYCIVVSGEDSWARSTAMEICQVHGNERVFTISSRENLVDTGTAGKIIKPGKARLFLGTETDTVVVDCHGDFAPDAVGILSGTIRAGGFLVLTTPPLETWANRGVNAGNRSGPESGKAVSLYISRLSRILIESDQVVRVTQGGDNPSLPVIPVEGAPVTICFDDQERAIAAVKGVVSGQRKKPVVLLSDRGRGKSAALGLAARALLDTQLDSVIVTGAGRASVATVFKHAEYGMDGGDGKLQYWPAGKLIRDKPQTGLLLVDEAASIPLPMLETLLQLYSRIAFASTVHGYEGTGRGFILRFKEILDRYSRGWKICELHLPIRWASGDPLESLVLDLLLMNAEMTDGQTTAGLVGNPEFEVVDKQRLCGDENLLREIFALLTQAHYRTRPADLMALLDADKLEVLRLYHENETLAVALVATEGNAEPEDAISVWKNSRRPKNGLLPETFCAQLGFIEAMQMRFARIVRIVVKPQYQDNGLGSLMLKHFEDFYGNKFDMLGASFGVSPELLGFWFKNNYRVARIGIGKSHSTGTHSCMLVKGISNAGRKLQARAEAKMLRNLFHQLTDSLQSLDAETVVKIYAASEKDETKPDLDSQDFRDLVAVGYAGRSLADAASALVKLARLAIVSDSAVLDKQHRMFMVERFLQQKSWDKCRALPAPRGRNAGTALCREIVVRFLSSEYRPLILPILEEFQLDGEEDNRSWLSENRGL